MGSRRRRLLELGKGGRVRKGPTSFSELPVGETPHIFRVGSKLTYLRHEAVKLRDSHCWKCSKLTYLRHQAVKLRDPHCWKWEYPDNPAGLKHFHFTKYFPSWNYKQKIEA